MGRLYGLHQTRLHSKPSNRYKKLYADANKLTSIDLNNLSGNPVLNNKDLLFRNWSAADKVKNLWRRENETNTNLETLRRTQKPKELKLY